MLTYTVVVAGCATSSHGNLVRIDGSDTMFKLNRSLAETFMRGHPGFAIRVEGGGTRTGVEKLIAGEIDLCAASRPFSSGEIAALHESTGTLGVRLLVARDALSIYVNPANPVADLTFDQLAAVFTGAVADWSELGGPDRLITVVVRPPTSGTHRFFRDHVLRGEDFTPSARVASRTEDVVRIVAGEAGAIGFGGLVFGPGLVHCRIDGTAPSAETVREGTYPLSRYLYFYATEPPTGGVKTFTDWCVGREGQAVVADSGFIPLWVPAR